MQLTFDRDQHRYTMDGRFVPGITAMLRAAGLLERMEFIPEQYRDRGSAVHLWVEAMLLGRIRKSTAVPPLVAPYLEAVRHALADTGAQVLAVEELVGNRYYRYATQVDLRVEWLGTTFVWNLKTGNAYPHYPIQLALESMCYDPLPRRASLFVSKAGRYHVDEYRDPGDYATARAIAARSLAQLTQAERHNAEQDHDQHPGGDRAAGHGGTRKPVTRAGR